jgi:hypothetical protein
MYKRKETSWKDKQLFAPQEGVFSLQLDVCQSNEWVLVTGLCLICYSGVFAVFLLLIVASTAYDVLMKGKGLIYI